MANLNTLHRGIKVQKESVNQRFTSQRFVSESIPLQHWDLAVRSGKGRELLLTAIWQLYRLKNIEVSKIVSIVFIALFERQSS